MRPSYIGMCASLQNCFGPSNTQNNKMAPHDSGIVPSRRATSRICSCHRVPGLRDLHVGRQWRWRTGSRLTPFSLKVARMSVHRHGVSRCVTLEARRACGTMKPDLRNWRARCAGTTGGGGASAAAPRRARCAMGSPKRARLRSDASSSGSSAVRANGLPASARMRAAASSRDRICHRGYTTCERVSGREGFTETSDGDAPAAPHQRLRPLLAPPNSTSMHAARLPPRTHVRSHAAKPFRHPRATQALPDGPTCITPVLCSQHSARKCAP